MVLFPCLPSLLAFDRVFVAYPARMSCIVHAGLSLLGAGIIGAHCHNQAQFLFSVLVAEVTNILSTGEEPCLGSGLLPLPRVGVGVSWGGWLGSRDTESTFSVGPLCQILLVNHVCDLGPQGTNSYGHHTVKLLFGVGSSSGQQHTEAMLFLFSIWQSGRVTLGDRKWGGGVALEDLACCWLFCLSFFWPQVCTLRALH